MAQRTDLMALVAYPPRFASDCRVAMVALCLLTGATPPDPGFDSDVPAFAQPRHYAPINQVTAQQAVARLVELRLLDSESDAQDPAKLAAAIKGFQSGIGIKPTGVLDRKTLALLAL